MVEVVKIILWIAYFISLYFSVFWFLVFLEDKPKQKTKKLTKLPFVSIVIPAYNEEKRVRLTIESVLKLNYPKNKYEVLVINDGSTDNTSRVVKETIKKYKDFNIKLMIN